MTSWMRSMNPDQSPLPSSLDTKLCRRANAPAVSRAFRVDPRAARDPHLSPANHFNWYQAVPIRAVASPIGPRISIAICDHGSPDPTIPVTGICLAQTRGAPEAPESSTCVAGAAKGATQRAPPPPAQRWSCAFAVSAEMRIRHTILHSEQNVVRQPVRELVRELVREPVRDPARDPVREPIRDPVW